MHEAITPLRRGDYIRIWLRRTYDETNKRSEPLAAYSQTHAVYWLL